MDIQGEYWVINGSAEYADGDNGDKNHEMIAYEHIANEHIDAINDLAESLGLQVPNLNTLDFENVVEITHGLLDSIRKKLFEQNDPKQLPERLPLFKSENEIFNEIQKRLNIDKEALQILMEGVHFGSPLDPRVYMMKKEGWIVVRNNNIELYGIDNKKLENLSSGIDSIIDQEAEWSEEEINDEYLEFNLFDHKTKKSMDVTLKDIKEKNLFRPQRIPQTKYNAFFIPPPKAGTIGSQSPRNIDARTRSLMSTSEAITAKDILKGAAIGGAFMVPVAGIPLALYLARKFYGSRATPEQVKEIEKQLGEKKASFKEWLRIDEMASFSFPFKIEIKGKEYSLVDMKFENEPKTYDRDGHVMNQGSKFLAKIPDSNEYIVYDGKGYSKVLLPSEVKGLHQQGYELIPEDWYKKATFV